MAASPSKRSQKTSNPQRITIVGQWHQATVLAACFSEMGHTVIGVGDDADAAGSLSRGRAPVHEPKLNAMLRRNLKAGRLQFTTDFGDALHGADFVYLAIDTPVDEEDRPELQSVEEAARRVGACRSGDLVLCVTSQVPSGTSERLGKTVREQKNGGACHLAYVPEFLRLGQAVETFFKADRFVIGAENEEVADRVADLYRPLGRPIVITDVRTAEMAKHASNTYLATSISFINEIADLCEQTGADTNDVVKAMKLDCRIGPHAFLSPGLGFAGGTLGRDIRAVQELGHRHGCPTLLMDAVLHINHSRADVVERRLQEMCRQLRGARVGILGVTYKPGTSTLRRSVALDIIGRLVGHGCEVRVYDPLADFASAGAVPQFTIAADAYRLAEGCDALVLITEWAGIRELDFPRMRSAMRGRALLDTRNVLDGAAMRSVGFDYRCLGKPGPSASIAATG